MDPIDPQFQKTVRELQLKFTRFYACFLSKRNLTFSQFALVSLVYHGGETPMSKLAKKLMISLPAVTHLTDRLERERFIKRIPHGSDRRVTLIRITKRGVAAVEETQGRIQKLFIKTLLDFHPRERPIIQDFYVRFSGELEKQLYAEQSVPEQSVPGTKGTR